jgi:hypothetical protein
VVQAVALLLCNLEALSPLKKKKKKKKPQPGNYWGKTFVLYSLTYSREALRRTLAEMMVSSHRELPAEGSFQHA